MLFDWSKLLMQLGVLSLGQNLLTGTLPDALSSLVQLKGLFLNDNNLTGTLPDAWSSLSQARHHTSYAYNIKFMNAY